MDGKKQRRGQTFDLLSIIIKCFLSKNMEINYRSPTCVYISETYGIRFFALRQLKLRIMFLVLFLSRTYTLFVSSDVWMEHMFDDNEELL